MALGSDELVITARYRDLMSRGLKLSEADLKRFGRAGRQAATESGALRKVIGDVAKVGTLIYGFHVLSSIARRAGRALFEFGRENVRAAASAEELASRFGVVFGEEAPEASKEVDRLAAVMGRSREELRGMAADVQTMLTAMGLSEEQAAQLSVATAALAVDTASFRDAQDAEVLRKFTSGITGEAEAMKSLGVNLKETAVQQRAFQLTGKRNAEELTEQEKALARLSLSFEGLEKAQGDAVRTASSFTNQTKQIQGAVKDLRVEMGQDTIRQIQEMVESMGGIEAVVARIRVAFELLTATIEFSLEQIERIPGVDGQIGAAVRQAEADILRGKIQALVGDAEKARDIFRQVGEETRAALDVNAVGEYREAILSAQSAIATLQTEGLGVVDADRKIAALEQALEGYLRLTPEFAAEFNRRLKIELEKLRNESPGAGVPDFGGLAAGLAGPSGPSPEERVKGFQTLLRSIQADLPQSFDQQRTAVAALTEARRAEISELVKSLGLRTEEARLLQETSARLAEHQLKLIADAEATAQAAEAKRAYNAALEALPDAQEGVARGFDRFKADFQDTARLVEDFTYGGLVAFADGFSNAFAEWVTGAKSAKEAFRDFAIDFLSQLARMAAQALVFRSIAALIPGGGAFLGAGFATGGVAPGGLGPITPFATGGIAPGGLDMIGYADGGPIVRRPHMAVVGEGRYDEAIVPLPDGRSIPVEMRGGGGVVVNFNISAVDGRSVESMLVEKRGTIESIIADAMARRRSFRGTMQGGTPA